METATLLDCAVRWLQTHAQIIALVEFALLVVGIPSTVIGWFWIRRGFRRQLASLEARAEARHREIVALNEVMSQLEFVRLNEEYNFAELPKGTRLVKSSKGRLHLATPVYLTRFFGTAGEATASITGIIKDADERDGRLGITGVGGAGGEFVDPEPGKLSRAPKGSS